MKIKPFLVAHKALVKDVVTSTCLLGGSASIVFGVSAGCFKIEYMDLDNAYSRYSAARNSSYYVNDIKSEWNMKGGVTPEGLIIEATEAPTWRVMRGTEGQSGLFFNDAAETWWHTKVHPSADIHKPLWWKYDSLDMDHDGELTDREAITNRYNYAALVIDGSNHSVLDRSFNESLYRGFVDFNRNYKTPRCDPETYNDPWNHYIAKAFKPTQDTTTDLVQVYASVIKTFDVVGLAGFNHATPLNAMMTHKALQGGKADNLASNPDPETDKNLNQTGFVLVDANVPNNQNVTSALFRADQPGFLTSIATCQYFMNNLHIYHDHYQDLSVGIFGGIPLPTVMDYMGGFQRGIEFFNNHILINIIEDGAKAYFGVTGDFGPTVESFEEKILQHSKYKNEIEEIKSQEGKTPAEKFEEYDEQIKGHIFNEYKVKIIKLGGFETNFSGSFNVSAGIGITKQFLNRGASAIVVVAGPQSLDAAQEVQNQHSKCIVIGVDTAMEDGDYQRFHAGCGEWTREKINENDPLVDKTMGINPTTGEPDPTDRSPQSNAVIKFSAIKDIRSVSEKVTRLNARGENWDISDDNDPEKPNPERAVCGPGFLTCANLKNGLVSISWDGFYPLIQALRHIKFNNPKIPTKPYDFDSRWNEAATTYWTYYHEKEDIPEEYLSETGGGVREVNNLCTFRKTDSEGNPTIYYDNFDRTMIILSYLFDGENNTITFTPNESLDEDHEKLSGDKQYTILDWLTYNMYFTC